MTELKQSPSAEHERRSWPALLSPLSDLLVFLAGALLVWRAWVVGERLLARGVNIYLDLPPLFASWAPHTGPGTVPAIVLALLVVIAGPTVASRMRWGPLLAVTYPVTLGWMFSLTMIEGWSFGVVTKLSNPKNYLAEIDRVETVASMLRHFTERILLEPGSWAVHVSGHPPGVLMVFVWLDRIGLGGGIAASVFCMLVGSTTVLAIATTLRALGEEHIARAVLPFGVLLPGMVWMGVSADAMFAGVTACGIALLAVGTSRGDRRGDLAALAGGILLGFTLYLSYGLVLAGVFALVVLALTRRLRPTLFAIAGAAVVVVLFTVHGFWWLEGYELVRIRYYQGIAATRPYSYFVWANLACVVLVAGPAVLAGLRRLAMAPRRLALGARLLTVAALLAIAAADLSGMSKAEVERIWLPFTMWLAVPCAVLPRGQHRWWLAAQAALALLINHLIITRW
ncbi:hypothetical protein SAMN04487905_11529 [Actinopolyspora xinjiangensis]|uniref:Integral membrane protein n=1 Tax=Actinopolyspora xinjiangensis TaxID=405564 RepID=A0A1H0WSV1_9ACTN|nr:hypothetical protein [Actinopolyspora xinjiangensis]SDP93761.1 hypothetical protein SAMN04487905_11529 [Actinopolyspora xinjiangensis]